VINSLNDQRASAENGNFPNTLHLSIALHAFLLTIVYIAEISDNNVPAIMLLCYYAQELIALKIYASILIQ
jgi:hypothetical protein